MASAPIAEGFDILKGKASEALPEDERYDLNLGEIAEVWRRGSVVSSWLLDLSAQALADDGTLSKFTGAVDDSGEGRWTISTQRDRGGGAGRRPRRRPLRPLPLPPGAHLRRTPALRHALRLRRPRGGSGATLAPRARALRGDILAGVGRHRRARARCRCAFAAPRDAPLNRDAGLPPPGRDQLRGRLDQAARQAPHRDQVVADHIAAKLGWRGGRGRRRVGLRRGPEVAHLGPRPRAWPPPGAGWPAGWVRSGARPRCSRSAPAPARTPYNAPPASGRLSWWLRCWRRPGTPFPSSAADR